MHHSCLAEIQLFFVHSGQCNISTAYSFTDISQKAVDLNLMFLNRKQSQTKWAQDRYWDCSE